MSGARLVDGEPSELESGHDDAPGSAAPSSLPDAGTRPGIYLWAGDATVDLLRFKFPDRPVREEEHRTAHEPEAARRLAEAGFGWAFLSMNWGFPPETERGHWADFRRAAEIYREHGFRVAAYVQASNCAATGSYARRSWYARTPGGRRPAYFRKRLMTCWNHPEWREEVERRVLRAARAGADAVFLDNLWMGQTPWMLGGRPGGFAGCACRRCRAEFRADTGMELPERLEPRSQRTEAYLAWRADVVRRRLEEWRRSLRARHPGVGLIANNCDAVLRDTRSLFGLDPAQLARHQDAVLLENVAMPGFEPARGRLVANALPVKAMRAWTGRPVWTVTYESGIGVDGPPEPRWAARALAESAAAGGRPVAKGGEYLDGHGRFTVITDESFRPALEGMARIARWLAGPASRLVGGEPAAGVGVYLDREGMSRRWASTAPATIALGLALLRAGVPFRYVTGEGLRGGGRDGDGNRRLLVPPAVPLPAGGESRAIRVGRQVLEVPAEPAEWTGEDTLRRRVAGGVIGTAADAYFRSARVRRLLEDTGLVGRFLESPLFELPRVDGRALHQLLPPLPPPAVRSESPVLVERWRGPEGGLRVHLVNYGDRPVTVRLEPDDLGRPDLHTPDSATRPSGRFEGDGAALGLELDLYAILEWKKGKSGE